MAGQNNTKVYKRPIPKGCTEENWLFNDDYSIKRVLYKGQECKVWIRKTYKYDADLIRQWSDLPEEIREAQLYKERFVIYPEDKEGNRVRKFISLNNT